MTSEDIKHQLNNNNIRAQELCESLGGRPGLPVPNDPCGLCGREADDELMLNVLRCQLTY